MALYSRYAGTTRQKLADMRLLRTSTGGAGCPSSAATLIFRLTLDE
jgi:hypothetical protein